MDSWDPGRLPNGPTATSGHHPGGGPRLVHPHQHQPAPRPAHHRPPSLEQLRARSQSQDSENPYAEIPEVAEEAVGRTVVEHAPQQSAPRAQVVERVERTVVDHAQQQQQLAPSLQALAASTPASPSPPREQRPPYQPNGGVPGRATPLQHHQERPHPSSPVANGGDAPHGSASLVEDLGDDLLWLQRQQYKLQQKRAMDSGGLPPFPQYQHGGLEGPPATPVRGSSRHVTANWHTQLGQHQSPSPSPSPAGGLPPLSPRHDHHPRTLLVQKDVVPLASSTPARPLEMTPTRPLEMTPTRPLEMDPTRPLEMDPARPLDVTYGTAFQSKQPEEIMPASGMVAYRIAGINAKQQEERGRRQQQLAAARASSHRPVKRSRSAGGDFADNSLRTRTMATSDPDSQQQQQQQQQQQARRARSPSPISSRAAEAWLKNPGGVPRQEDDYWNRQEGLKRRQRWQSEGGESEGSEGVASSPPMAPTTPRFPVTPKTPYANMLNTPMAMLGREAAQEAATGLKKARFFPEYEHKHEEPVAVVATERVTPPVMATEGVAPTVVTATERVAPTVVTATERVAPPVTATERVAPTAVTATERVAPTAVTATERVAPTAVTPTAGFTAFSDTVRSSPHTNTPPFQEYQYRRPASFELLRQPITVEVWPGVARTADEMAVEPTAVDYNYQMPSPSSINSEVMHYTNQASRVRAPSTSSDLGPRASPAYSNLSHRAPSTTSDLGPRVRQPYASSSEAAQETTPSNGDLALFEMDTAVSPTRATPLFPKDADSYLQQQRPRGESRVRGLSPMTLASRRHSPGLFEDDWSQKPAVLYPTFSERMRRSYRNQIQAENATTVDAPRKASHRSVSNDRVSDRSPSPQAHHGAHSTRGGLLSPSSFSQNSSGRSSPSSLYYLSQNTGSQGSLTEHEQGKVFHKHPKFIKDTSSAWYKANISRDETINMLKHSVPGSFIVRDSNSFPGAFGLALKVATPPVGVANKKGEDPSNELVRHFLIEPTGEGVKLKGCSNEPVFGSLSALVYQHSITPLALPCKLLLPESDPSVPGGAPRSQSPDKTATNNATSLLEQGAACNVLYLHSVEMECLTGPNAVGKAVAQVQASRSQTTPTVVHFKVNSSGITLTDNERKVFFRRHHPVNSVTYCGLDPEHRKWSKLEGGIPDLRIFGFVAHKPGSCTDNSCHLFAELDPEQPATAIVNFVTRVMMGSAA